MMTYSVLVTGGETCPLVMKKEHSSLVTACLKARDAMRDRGSDEAMILERQATGDGVVTTYVVREDEGAFILYRLGPGDQPSWQIEDEGLRAIPAVSLEEDL